MIMMIATWKDLFECLDQFYHQGKFFLLRNREHLGEGAIDRRSDGWETISIGFDWYHLHELDSKSINIHDITQPWSLVKNMSTRLQSILWPFCQVTQLLTFQVRRHEIFLSSWTDWSLRRDSKMSKVNPNDDNDNNNNNNNNNDQ